MEKKFPKYTGKIVKRTPDGKEEIVGFISLWEFTPKEAVKQE